MIIKFCCFHSTQGRVYDSVQDFHNGVRGYLGRAYTGGKVKDLFLALSFYLIAFLCCAVSAGCVVTCNCHPVQVNLVFFNPDENAVTVLMPDDLSVLSKYQLDGMCVCLFVCLYISTYIWSIVHVCIRTCSRHCGTNGFFPTFQMLQRTLCTCCRTRNVLDEFLDCF